MPSAKSKSKADGLEAEQADQLSQAERVARLEHTPPLYRDEDHLNPIQSESKYSPDELQPNLTATGVSALSLQADEREAQDASAEEDDEPSRFIHPSRLAPDSERVKAASSRLPAAGPGTWPIPEDQLPAVMPEDPPAESRLEAGSKTFASVSGVKVHAGGEIEVKSSRGGNLSITVPKKQVAQAAHIWMQLRIQHPQFTMAQLQDEFYLRVEQLLPIAAQSPHGQTAAGDDRVNQSAPGADAQDV